MIFGVITPRSRFRPKADRTACASRHTAALLVALASGLALPSAAQDASPFQRPSEQRPQLPTPEELEPPPVFELPGVPEVLGPSELEEPDAARIPVHEIRIVGSTVFDDADFADVVGEYAGRALSASELAQLRDELTLVYVNAGYRTSGVVLPPQDLSDGIVELRAVEGRLVRIEIDGNYWLGDGYFESRLQRAAGQPLQLQDLENQLQIFLQDSRIRRIHAQLGPGELPGEGVLRLQVEEAFPVVGVLHLDNHESPAIGSFGGGVDVSHESLTRHADRLAFRGKWTEGFQDYEGGYELTLNSWDTALGAHYRYGESEVVEDPFDALDIRSKVQTIGFTLNQPVLWTPSDRVLLFLTGEWRESKTYLLGDRFSFQPGPHRGRSVVSVLRFGQEWIHRDPVQALAARSTLSVGVDALGATTNSGDTPDGRFLVWLAQLQWTRRFDALAGVQLLARADLQLSTSALLSMEQFAVGGPATVRGYRENLLVRDNGFVGSLELRIPLASNASGSRWIQLAPFFDVGTSWNSERGTPSPRTIEGAGIGLRFGLTRHLAGELYWAEALRNVDVPSDDDLQDDGITFRVAVTF